MVVSFTVEVPDEVDEDLLSLTIGDLKYANVFVDEDKGKEVIRVKIIDYETQACFRV